MIKLQEEATQSHDVSLIVKYIKGNYYFLKTNSYWSKVLYTELLGV